MCVCTGRKGQGVGLMWGGTVATHLTKLNKPVNDRQRQRSTHLAPFLRNLSFLLFIFLLPSLPLLYTASLPLRVKASPFCQSSHHSRPSEPLSFSLFVLPRDYYHEDVFVHCATTPFHILPPGSRTAISPFWYHPSSDHCLFFPLHPSYLGNDILSPISL